MYILNFISIYIQRFNILLTARAIQASETNGLSFSPITEKFRIIPEKPSLKFFILDGHALFKYVLKHIKSTIIVIIL